MLKSLFSKHRNVGKAVVTKKLQFMELWPRVIVRALQVILALVVIGFYANRVDNDRKAGKAQDPSWVYAVVVASMSAITGVAFAFPQPFFQTARLFAWDLVLFILWIAVFGTFAGKFLKRTEDEVDGISVTKMKVAVWFDLVNSIFWLGTGVYGAFRVFVGQKVEAKFDQGMNKLDNKFNERVAQTTVGKTFNEFDEKVDAYLPQVHDFHGNRFQGHHAV